MICPIGVYGSHLYTTIGCVVFRLLSVVYDICCIEIYPLSSLRTLPPRKTSRNEAIKQKFADGSDVSTIAEEFGISEQRVHQIINFKN
jgi:hypothetical protein